MKRRFLRETILDMKIQFIGIQETIKSDFSKEELNYLFGDQDFFWFWSPPRGRSGGILVGTDMNFFNVTNSCVDDLFVKVSLQNKNDKFMWDLVVVAYGPAQNEGKVSFLTKLAQILNGSNLPLCLAGDFNLIRRSCENNKPRGCNRWSFLFNSIIASAGLLEIKMSDRRFTWSNDYENPTFELLDRVLVSIP